MTAFTHEHGAIMEALALVEDLETTLDRDAKRAMIAIALVHSDEDEVRRQLILIETAWHKYCLLLELYAAYGNETDREQAKTQIKRLIEAEESDGADEQEKLVEVRQKVRTGWRSRPEQLLLDPTQSRRSLDRSDQRLKELRRMGSPRIALLGEYCLRIIYGEIKSIAPAMKLAKDSAEDRDRITLAIGKSYVYMGKLANAREHLKKVVFPENQIDLLVAIFLMERELSPQAMAEVVH